jgi:hypothetical protein
MQTLATIRSKTFTAQLKLHGDRVLLTAHALQFMLGWPIWRVRLHCQRRGLAIDDGEQPMQQLAAMERMLQVSQQTNDLVQLAKFLILSKGSMRAAAQLARSMNASRASDILTKAAQSAGGLSSWGAELTDFKLVVDGFAQSLHNIGVFDAMLAGGMRRAPITSRLGAVLIGAAAFIVGEGSLKPVSRLTLTGPTQIEARKAAALVTVTQELLTMGGPAGQALLTRELQNACVLAVDTAFITIITSGVAVGTSTGSTPVAVRSDLLYLLTQFRLTLPRGCSSSPLRPSPRFGASWADHRRQLKRRSQT